MAVKYKIWLHLERIDEENDEYEEVGEPDELFCSESREEADAAWGELVACALARNEG